MALPGVARDFPALARRSVVGCEEGEIQVIELLVPHPLDERDFIAHGFQLAQGLVIVEQFHIDRGKVPVVQDLGHFLAAQRGRAHHGDAIRFGAHGVSSRNRRRFQGRTHEGCEASLCAGGAGGEGRRRKIHCNRHSTPENV